MDNSLGKTYIESVSKRMLSYKDLGEKTFAQLEDQDFHFRPNDESNSIAIIVRHMSGNMLSRWTNFLVEDGEKTWRNRDSEFEMPDYSRPELTDIWEKGWNCLLTTLASLTPDDLLKTIRIRQESLSAIDAINRQLAHYPYHVGQIVYLGKIIKDNKWKSLSIPKGRSESFNREMPSTQKK